MKITVIAEKEYELQCDEPTLISSALMRCGVLLSQPCGGNGRCGKCRVLVSGEASPPDGVERERLTQSELARGIRLACRAYALGEVTVKPVQSGKISGISEGFSTAFVKAPLTGEKSCFGAAVDIGTTTVAAYLYKLPEGEEAGCVCLPNTQAVHGADVVSRLAYANSGGLSQLQSEIKAVLRDIADIFGEQIEQYVITGNTAMLHFYAGLKTDGLAVSPFRAESLFGINEENAYLPRCISAFVGADTVCGVLASGMLADSRSLLIDIGTNGEIVYNSPSGLLCCSTAAGPVFEGAGISNGMAAADGAIDHVYFDNRKWSYSVIGGTAPEGICGSGIIDAVACMLASGVLDETGYLAEPFFIGDSGISVSPADIRAVQLAKAAIRAGIETLCKSPDTLDRFCLAGGFGSLVDLKSCAAIGLIPQSLLGKAEVLGNAAGAGAAMILQSRACLEQAEKIARSAKAVELATDSFFIEKYIEYMSFNK